VTKEPIAAVVQRGSGTTRLQEYWAYELRPMGSRCWRWRWETTDGYFTFASGYRWGRVRAERTALRKIERERERRDAMAEHTIRKTVR
jgi:surface antigen